MYAIPDTSSPVNKHAPIDFRVAAPDSSAQRDDRAWKGSAPSSCSLPRHQPSSLRETKARQEQRWTDQKRSWRAENEVGRDSTGIERQIRAEAKAGGASACEVIPRITSEISSTLQTVWLLMKVPIEALLSTAIMMPPCREGKSGTAL